MAKKRRNLDQRLFPASPCVKVFFFYKKKKKKKKEKKKKKKKKKKNLFWVLRQANLLSGHLAKQPDIQSKYPDRLHSDGLHVQKPRQTVWTSRLQRPLAFTLSDFLLWLSNI